MYRPFIKSILDICLSFILLIILSPIILVVALLITILMGRPICFKQARGGYKGNIFYLYKFRTMNNKKDALGELLPDHQRLTKFGQFLRSSSLDELPGLVNVLFCQLSLVGPRPFIAEYLPLYNQEQARRHSVRPGITGWAQVNGRNAISWEEKFKLDCWYVDNQSFLLDLKILLLTVKKVFFKENISAKNSVTMEKFKGSVL